METIKEMAEKYARKAHLATGINPNLMETTLIEALSEFKNLQQGDVSGMLSPIVPITFIPTEFWILDKAKEKYGTPRYKNGKEIAFAEGAKWMKKMLLGDNFR